MINDDPDTVKDRPYIGLCMDLLDVLHTNLGFNYVVEVVPDGNYGGIDSVTGQWNGMVGELIRDVSRDKTKLFIQYIHNINYISTHRASYKIYILN